MVTQAIIDKTIADFESNYSQFEKLLSQIENHNEDLINLLIGEHEEETSEDEFNFLVFLFLVIYKSVETVRSIPIFDAQEIADTEELIWDYVNLENNFNKIIDHYYTLVPESELLEFIELSIGPVDDSEIKITDSGRLILFVSLMTEVMLLSKNVKSE